MCVPPARCTDFQSARLGVARGHYLQRLATGAIVASVLCGAQSATWSADIRLRSTVRVDRAVVRLGDIADIRAQRNNMAERLASVELLPAPAAGGQRFLHVRAIRDLLHARGENLLEHRFAGASQVKIIAAPAADGDANAGRGSERSARRMRERVVQAIDEYLNQQAPDRGPWAVQVNLNSDQLRRLAADRGAWRVSGGSAPWSGDQSFVFRVAGRGHHGPDVEVRAQVRVAPSVVVAKRRIARGAIVRATDVQLVRHTTDVRHPAGDLPKTLDEIVGNEATRAIAIGAVLDRSAVRRPVLVHRNEIVTVFARAAGIVARTNARAREDGSRGDLILVESLDDRKTFHARVTGLAEVDVFAQPARAETTP